MKKHDNRLRISGVLDVISLLVTGAILSTIISIGRDFDERWAELSADVRQSLPPASS